MTQVTNLKFIYLGLLALWLAFAACKPAPKSDDAAAADSVITAEQAQDCNCGESCQKCGAEDSAEQFYSPFLIRMTDGEVFKTISFKDVGLHREMMEGGGELLLEAIAESLAYHLVQDKRLSFTPQVVYDAEIIEPAKHLFCEEHHLYVDLWRGDSPDRWGYSLWSGCSEEHNFAWKEVAVDTAREDDLIDSVAPLTESIVESLANAAQKSCYVSKC